MDRRNFLKLASCAGLTVVTPSVFAGRDLSGKHRTSEEPYTGTLFLFFNAGGGWDPTHMCDPKPKSSENDPNPVTNVLDIGQSGNIQYPTVFPAENYDPGMVGGVGSGIPAFFETFYDRLTVVNGIDMQTNGHDSGSRHTWSGQLNEGYPSIAAYLAASFDPSLPMAFLSFGGYSLTQGMVPMTRAGNLGALSRIAYPSRINPDDETSVFHSQRALELIDEAQWHRDQALRDGNGLPRIRRAINTLFMSRSGSNELKLLQQYLPAELSPNALERQAQVAIAAYKAGICISANLNTGGFDTHGTHDQNHIPRLETLLSGIGFAMQEAERQGVAQNVVIAAGSDFGRTPGYNDGNGKDHWSVTSMLFMGAGIPGNRVIGATDELHRPYGINPDKSINTAEGARRIEPKDIHFSLRKLAGAHETEMAAMFPLNVSDPVDIFA